MKVVAIENVLGYFLFEQLTQNLHPGQRDGGFLAEFVHLGEIPGRVQRQFPKLRPLVLAVIHVAEASLDLEVSQILAQSQVKLQSVLQPPKDGIGSGLGVPEL